MGFVKGTDGIASTLRNTLEGSVGNIALENISAVTLTSTANVTGGNLITAGQISAGGNVTSGNVSVTGNVTGNYILGNGSQLTGIAASYGNSNVATFLAAYGSNTVSTTGNITSGNILTSGLISATGNVTSGNILTSGLISATGNVTSGNVLTGGLISATGNVSGNYFIGNGSQLTGIAASYGNSNVATFLAAYGSNTISTSGNVTAGNLIGNISITGNVTGTSSNVTLVAGAYSTVFDNTGNATFANGTVSLTTLSAAGNVSAGNLNITGNIVDSGALTIITGSNGNIALAPNGTGIVAASGAFSAVGNVTGGNVNTGAQVVATGNITGGNILTAGLATVTGNITGGNLVTAGLITATGNVSGGNLNVTGNIVDTGALTIITGSSGNVTLAPNGTNVLVVTTTGIVGNVLAATTTTAANNVGYLGMPQNATGTATLTIADAGRHVYVTSAGQTITIPANSSVAYPIGTAIAFIAGPSATTVSIAITSDTMYLAGTGTTGTRTLAAYGMATAVKVAATTWYINGSGLT